VAISDAEADTVAIHKVVGEFAERFVTWEKLDEAPLVILPSKFVRQVRHVTEGKPLMHCNGELLSMQLLICYANHYIELVEIFLRSEHSKEAPVIERQYIYAY